MPPDTAPCGLSWNFPISSPPCGLRGPFSTYDNISLSPNYLPIQSIYSRFPHRPPPVWAHLRHYSLGVQDDYINLSILHLAFTTSVQHGQNRYLSSDKWAEPIFSTAAETYIPASGGYNADELKPHTRRCRHRSRLQKAYDEKEPPNQNQNQKPSRRMRNNEQAPRVNNNAKKPEQPSPLKADSGSQATTGEQRASKVESSAAESSSSKIWPSYACQIDWFETRSIHCKLYSIKYLLSI